MEKKSGRFVQSQLKGPNFDKKNQDSNNGKLWAKGGNRRESASGSLPIKPEAVRKNPPQRFKSFDKRPRPRGRTDAMARDEKPSLEEQQAELGSVFQPGSKKQSLNHLLNFTYTARNGELSQYKNRTPYNKNGNHSFTGKRHKYVKEHFLQANCQFIVNSTGDYKQYLNDPDALVEWHYIEQINVQVNESPSCPICLHPPAAAKITRCGHIYCWCCILHYLSFSDHPYQKCPICYENVCKDDLKSVVVFPHNTFNIGETITFKLMKRNENSLTPYPATEQTLGQNSLMNFSEDQPVKIYCKLLLAQNSDVLSIVNRECKELQYQLENEEESERSFVEEAIVYLKERETRLIVDLVREVNLAQSDVETCVKSASETKTEFGTGSANKDAVDKPLDSKYIYFYQASDGQHVYIHSVNVKMLKHCYGSLEHAPNVITAKILAKEEDSMTEEYRKRYKYLAHLPVTCPFGTIEIELQLPVVNQDTLDLFHDELEKRKKQRARKAKEEKRREKRITEEENIKLYKRYPSANIPLESSQQFPIFGNSVGLENVASLQMTDIDNNLPNISSQEYSGPSFAKMAAAAKTTPNPWPDLKSSPPTFTARTTPKLKDLNVISGRRRYDSNLSNGDDQEYVPEPTVTFGDAIAQALQKATQNDRTEDESLQSSDKNKKKKKNKQKILLSTSFHYSGN